MAVRPGSHIRNPQRDPRTAKVSTQVSSWLNFTPLSLNPELWFDSSDLSTITESGGAISQWNDKSGNGRNLTQGTGASQPSLTTNFNGLNTVTFDGSNDFMETVSVTITQPMWIYAAFNLPTTPANDADLVGTGGVANVAVRPRWSLGPAALMFAGQTGLTRSVPLPIGKYVWGVNFNGTSSNFRLNGLQSANGNAGTNGFAHPFRVARRVDGTVYLNVDIGEIIVTKKALTVNEARSLETYLNAKWAVY